MAATNREKLKQYLLLAFIALNVTLIGLIWAGNLSESPEDAGFVRATPIRVTIEPGATMPPHEEHKNRGKVTPEPTATPSSPATLPETVTPTRDSGDIGLHLPGRGNFQPGLVQ